MGQKKTIELPPRRPDGALNGIEVAKLKGKLGTRQLPTAELLLDGCEAVRVSPVGRGISSISNMLTVTRFHNAVMSVAAMRKVTFLARDYAQRRRAFGRPLCDHVLHGQTLARMEAETRGCLALVLDLARQMGREDCGTIGEEDSLLLRLMTPVAKMYTAKAAVAVSSEGLECFGGQGYIEETGLPGILRDAQVLPIWEGTSNVMSLDVLRSAAKSGGAVMDALGARVERACAKGKGSTDAVVARAAAEVEAAAAAIAQFLLRNPQLTEVGARDLTVSLSFILLFQWPLMNDIHLMTSTYPPQGHPPLSMTLMPFSGEPRAHLHRRPPAGALPARHGGGWGPLHSPALARAGSRTGGHKLCPRILRGRRRFVQVLCARGL